MNEALQVKRPIYPLVGLICTVIILVTGLITAKQISSLYFLAAVWVLFLMFGYWRACLAVIPAAAIMSAILAGITYLISHDLAATQAAISRILAICVAVIPGLALSPVILVRSFSALKMPRMFTLGMMITLNFFPLLGAEVCQVREAMKTRGAGNVWSFQIFYRAFLIPLMMRLVNISDTLALSVETRGFTTDNTVARSVYKTVTVRWADILFLVLVAAGAILTVIFRG